VCLMTAGADRALEVTSGTELFAAGVPVLGSHQLDGHAKIGLSLDPPINRLLFGVLE